MLLLPFRQSSQRFLLILPATDLDQGVLRDPSAGASLGRLHARRLTRLLAVVRRPGRIPLPLFFLSTGSFKNPLDHPAPPSIPAMPSAVLGNCFRLVPGLDFL